MKKVYTYGVWDMLHINHINSLKKAKDLGDYLIVGVFSDKVAEDFKRKPIISQEERTKMICELKVADLVVVQNEFSPLKNLEFLRPNVLAKGEGAGWENGTCPDYDEIKRLEIDIEFLPYHQGTSTSGIIKKIQSL